PRRWEAAHRRLDRCEALPLDARRTVGQGLRAGAEAACAVRFRDVPADRERARPRRHRIGRRPVIGLARLAGPVACLGLTLLLLARTRRDRLAGLGFAALGACMLAAALAPHDYAQAVGGSFAALAVACVLAAAFRRVPWQRLGLWALYAELTIMGIVFAVVGFYQYETRNVFENPKVIYSNAYAAFFRVNSVFWDPSVYGRFLVVAMIPS